MPTIDRGEGHPANAATALPAPPVHHPAAPPGMRHFAEAVRAQRVRLGGRLVVQHGPGVIEALRPWSAPGPVIMPGPRPDPDGEVPGSYLQVEFHPAAHLAPGEWLLARDGTVTASGRLGADGQGSPGDGSMVPRG